jgi:hypothetical protein
MPQLDRHPLYADPASFAGRSGFHFRVMKWNWQAAIKAE